MKHGDKDRALAACSSVFRLSAAYHLVERASLYHTCGIRGPDAFRGRRSLRNVVHVKRNPTFVDAQSVHRILRSGKQLQRCVDRDRPTVDGVAGWLKHEDGRHAVDGVAGWKKYEDGRNAVDGVDGWIKHEDGRHAVDGGAGG